MKVRSTNLPTMAVPPYSHRSAALQALTVFSVLAVLVAEVGARQHVCHPFSCGALSSISYPFRRQGDSPHCGPFELVCTSTNATIRIGNGIYNVLSINRTAYYFTSYFWVVDSNLGMQSSCPLPQWEWNYLADGPNSEQLFQPYYGLSWATFVNCSQEIKDSRYRPVRCLSTIDYFIYVLIGDYACSAQNFKPSCSYLAMTPLGGPGIKMSEDASYEDVVEVMRKGFAIRFTSISTSYYNVRVRECLVDAIREPRGEPRKRNVAGIVKQQILEILVIDFNFWNCIAQELGPTNVVASMLISTIPYALWALKCAHVFCRFVLAPLAIFTFLALKYWKIRITIDAVEKFLRMQQMLCGPMRYAYTDIIAITSHFREKLGQGGYGSVYKGVLFPGNVDVAIKILSNSKCNGDEFISEVSTIGRIHHVNVVHLLGFCSEETRRALVYEYMPNGSLDKLILSSEKSFSWDMLNEIALGIARGINYLHLGCDMQILHLECCCWRWLEEEEMLIRT